MDQNNNVNQELVPKIVWGALLFSHGVFIFVMTQFIYRAEQVAEKMHMLQYVIMGIATVMATISYFMNMKAKAQTELEKYFTFFILSCALAESVHIFGLVGHIAFGFSLTQYFSFAATGIFLHLLYFPKNMPKASGQP